MSFPALKRSVSRHIDETVGWMLTAIILAGYPFAMLTVFLLARSHVARSGAALDAAWLYSLFTWGIGASLFSLIVMMAALGVAMRLVQRSAAERHLAEEIEKVSHI